MPIQYGVPFSPSFIQSPVTSILAAGPRPPDFGNLDLFGGFIAGRDAAQKQALQEAFSGGLPKIEGTNTLDIAAIQNQLARLGGAPQLQNILTLENLEQQRKLPPIGYPTPPQAAAPVSLNKSSVRQATEPDDTGGGEPKPPGQNLVQPNEVPGSFRVDAGPTTKFASEPQDAAAPGYPPQFSQAPVTGPPTGRFTPPTPTTELMPRERVAQAQPQAAPQVTTSQIAPIPTQPQGNFNEQTLQYWQRRATVSNEMARRAGLAGNQGMEQAYRNDATQAQENAKSIQEGLIKLQGEQGKAQVDQEKAIFDESRKDFLTAKEGQVRLGLINDSIKKLGPTWMGPGADTRARLANSWNTFVGLMPAGVQDVVPKIQPEKVADWEDFNKQTLNLGFTLARTLGAREAMQIVQQATASVPNANQSYWGARLVSSAMSQAFQRQEDFHKYVIQLKRNGQSTLDADTSFNALNPPEKYVAKAVSVVPPQSAINYLQANPSPQNKRAFEQKYGDGALVGVFGTQ